MDGWVKNHRKIEEWKYYKVLGYAHLWQHILRQAHHSDTPIFDGYGNEIRKGQFSSGILRLARESGLSKGKVERILKKLEIEKQIEKRSSNKCSIITITSWHEYQQTGSETGNKQETGEKQTGNKQEQNKNAKNVKNEKNIDPKIPKIEIPGLEQEVTNWIGNVKDETRQKWLDIYPKEILSEEIEKAYTWNFEQTKKKQKKDIGRFLKTWFSRDWCPLKTYTEKSTYEKIMECPVIEESTPYQNWDEFMEACHD